MMYIYANAKWSKYMCNWPQLNLPFSVNNNNNMNWLNKNVDIKTYCTKLISCIDENGYKEHLLFWIIMYEI